MNRTVRFRVLGMDCGEEVSLLRAALSRVKGVRELHFDVARGLMEVAYAPELTSEAGIAAAVEGIGMRCRRWEEAARPEQGSQWERVALWLSGILLAGGLALEAWLGGEAVEVLLA
ncbi:MAG: cation transporter, partial [Bryobacteraceae bacterium]